MVATRDTLARDCPTQLRGPSAKGKYRLGCLLSSAWRTRFQGFIVPQTSTNQDRLALRVRLRIAHTICMRHMMPA